MPEPAVRPGLGPADGSTLPHERVVILNVDDYEAGRYATSRVLRQAGFDVVEAATGEDAVHRAREHPDLIVLDVNLPDFDGFEVCRRIREMPDSRNVPILYLSALYQDAEHRVLGLEVGADAYLKQPVDPRELVATVHALLRSRAVEAAVRGSERRFRTLVEATSQIVWTGDAAGGMTPGQPSWEAFSGQTPGEYADAGWMQAIHPAGREQAEAGWRAGLASGRAFDGDLRLRRADGEYRQMRSRAVPVLDTGGRVVEWIGSLEDVTDRRRVEAERDLALADAERARSDAEEASRAKSGFLANMSHEIRTPINAIMGYADLLELGVAGPLNERQHDHVERIRSSSRHLLGLIDDILDLAKIESGRMLVGSDARRLADVAEAALALVLPQATSRSLVVRNLVGPEDGTYLGDEDRVRQIVVNLLSNAVKFTAPGGSVTVRAGSAHSAEALPAPDTVPAGSVWVSVDDTGTGIPPEQLDAVFEPFVQGEGGHTRTKGGTGLGLAISRHLSRLMGGDITLRSTPGQGSSFTLWLPAGTAPAEPAHEG